MRLWAQGYGRDANGGNLAEKWFHRWGRDLSTAYPSSASPYWRALPVKRLKKLFAGTFFAAAGIGFAVDLLLLNHARWMHGLFWPAFCGAMAVSVSAARFKSARIAVSVWMVLLALGILAFSAALVSMPLDLSPSFYWRIVFDVFGIWLGTAFAFRLFLSFITSRGLEYVRMQTELSLAHGIQATLVPTISFQNRFFEAFGKSIPSAEMGGDIIDIAEGDGTLLAYVADVSGHGLAAGQLMGMLKTAMRLSLQFHQSPSALLEGADRVLPAVKEPGMYATLALLRFDGAGEGEFASAGHVPILHYRYQNRDVKQLSMEQFPLGLIPGGSYASQRISYSSGDLFLFLTDGVSEVENDSNEDFGLARLEQLMIENAAQPLPLMWETIQQETRNFGTQADDQTMLLIRILQ
jgi:serine phosphatase RsbU (regulator of sigma subunit)